MDEFTRENGKIILSTAKDMKNGQMGQFIKELIHVENQMVTENISGRMEKPMKENGRQV